MIHQIAAAGLAGLHLRVERGGLRLTLGNRLVQLLHLRLAVSAAPGQLVQLLLHALTGIPQTIQQHVVLLFCALQGDDVLLGLMLLLFGHVQLVLGLLQLAACLLGPLLGVAELFPQAVQLAAQTLELVGAAQHTGGAAH